MISLRYGFAILRDMFIAYETSATAHEQVLMVRLCSRHVVSQSPVPHQTLT